MIKNPRWLLTGLLLLASGQASATNQSELSTNEYLFGRQQIVSDCHYRVTMDNGNLVLYNWQGTSFWSSNTAGRGYYAVMQTDGNLVVYDMFNRALWASGTNGWPGAFAFIQTDRNFVVYNSVGVPKWASNTVDNSEFGTSIQPCNWSSEKTFIRPNFDLPGDDVASVPLTGTLSGYQACASFCANQEDQACSAFTWVPAGVKGPSPVCFIKNGVPTWTPHTGMYSGVIVRASHFDGNL